MILAILLIVYFKDVKEIGKENLSLPLEARLLVWFLFIALPVISAITYRVAE